MQIHSVGISKTNLSPLYPLAKDGTELLWDKIGQLYGITKHGIFESGDMTVHIHSMWYPSVVHIPIVCGIQACLWNVVPACQNRATSLLEAKGPKAGPERDTLG